jgi:hypothetical protein
VVSPTQGGGKRDRAREAGAGAIPGMILGDVAWGGDNPHVADGNRMVFLGFGKYARADKIYAIEPIRDDRRGHGRRTLVWVEGVTEPIVASRTERTILHEMGQQTGGTPLLDQALDLAERVAEQTQQGRVDVNDLGRRARRLLEATAKPNEGEKLF